MMDELFKIGDRVVFKVDPETRYWRDTYKDVPDGAEGIVCGIRDTVVYESRVRVFMRQPGVYHGKGVVSVWLADGRIVPGGYSISMVDKDEERRRDAAMRGTDGILWREYTRIGDLPSTKFWEMDKVRVRCPSEPEEDAVISRIDYGRLHERRNDGSPWPFYDVQSAEGGTMSIEESWATLTERGNLWKHYHNEPLSFASIKEEAGFFELIGQSEDVRNPASGLYCWTKEEVLDAIRNGTVHGFAMSSGFFGSGPSINAKRFKDEELGKRVARATLEGFGAAA